MRWTVYAETWRPTPESLFHALEFRDVEAVCAFCDWLAFWSADLELHARTSDLRVGDADDLAALVDEVAAGAALTGDIESMYAEFRTEVEAHRNFAEPAQEKAREMLRGSRIPQQAIALAFACGHGCHEAFDGHTTVPDSMNVHFVCDKTEALPMSNAFEVMSLGSAARSRDEYSGGSVIPNYRIYQVESDVVVAAAVQANIHDLPLYFAGDPAWDEAYADSTRLCSAPAVCAGDHENRHSCDGVLRTLGKVKNLYIMVCRGAPGGEASTYTVPGEMAPIDYIGNYLNSARVHLGDDARVRQDLERMQQKDPKSLAKIVSHSHAEEKISVLCAKDLLEKSGSLAYLAMYCAAPKAEQSTYDTSRTLRTAKRSAAKIVNEFREADSGRRMVILEKLVAEVSDPEEARRVEAFMAGKVPGWPAWRRHPEFHDEILKRNAVSVRAGGVFEAQYTDGVILVSDAERRYGHFRLSVRERFLNTGDSVRLVVRLTPPDDTQGSKYRISVRGALGGTVAREPRSGVLGLVRLVHGMDVVVE